MYVEINGLDESGTVGEPILFVRLGASMLIEPQIILRNIEYFNALMASKDLLKGYEPSTLFKYVLSFIEDPSFDVTIFRMFPETQLKILRDLSLLTAEDLFGSRRTLVKLFDSKGKMAKIDQDTLSDVSQTINTLKRFRNPNFWLDSYIKSFGMMLITMKLENLSKAFSKPGFTSYFLVVQIDGGFPFAFWWRGIMDKIPCFKKGSFIVSGVSNGDEYYPSMSTAGVIAGSLLRNREKLHLFPVHPLEYENAVDLNGFFEGHSKAIERPTFQNRILFVGKIGKNVRTCIPYLMHLRDRHKTYEVFKVGRSISWFFRVYGHGYPENTVIVYGSNLTSRDKESIKFCKENKYPLRHVSEFREEFQEFIKTLSSEIEYAPVQKRKTLSSRLKRIENQCLSEFK